MPAPFAMVDSNFPLLSPDKSTEEKINMLVNYMAALTEELKYSLQNLDTSNFNKTALEDYSLESTEDIRKAVEAMYSTMQTMTQVVTTLSGRVALINASVGKLDSTIQTMQEVFKVDENIVDIGGVDTTVNITGSVYINGKSIGE